MVEMLRPGARLADLKTVAGPLLRKLYEEEMAEVAAITKAKNTTLLIDRWSTVSSDPVIGIAVVVDSCCYLMDTIDTTGEPHTAENLSSKYALPAMSKAEELFRNTIVALLSDNTSNMKAMQDIITKIKPEILCIGFHAHWLNLLARDISSLAPFAERSMLQVLKWQRMCCQLAVQRRQHCGSGAPILDASNGIRSTKN